MIISTKNFHPESDPKLLCTCGSVQCDKRSVNQVTLNMLQVARDKFGKPMKVNSGGRCSYHPDEAHRSTPADHQKCRGVDISVSGSTRGDVVDAGLKAGFNAIGVAKTFVHLGYREELPEGKIVMWVY